MCCMEKSNHEGSLKCKIMCSAKWYGMQVFEHLYTHTYAQMSDKTSGKKKKSWKDWWKCSLKWYKPWGINS